MKGIHEDAVPDPEVSATPGVRGRRAKRRANTPAVLSALAHFDRHEVGGCAVLCAAGEIDVATAPAFRAALMDAVERSQHLVVDLSSVTFLDCAGLSALATVVRRVRATGDVVHFVGVTGVVGRVITLTRLDEVVVVDACVEDALAAMAPAS